MDHLCGSKTWRGQAARTDQSQGSSISEGAHPEGPRSLRVPGRRTPKENSLSWGCVKLHPAICPIHVTPTTSPCPMGIKGPSPPPHHSPGLPILRNVTTTHSSPPLTPWPLRAGGLPQPQADPPAPSPRPLLPNHFQALRGS